MNSSPTTDSVVPGQYGNTSTAVQVLEHLLQARKPFCSEGNTGAPTNSGLGAAGSRDSSTSQSTVQSLWEPIHPQRHSAQPAAKTMSSSHHYMTSSSSSSRPRDASLGRLSNHSTTPLQRLTPVSLPRNPSPAMNHARHEGQMFDFESQMSMSNTYNNRTTSIAHQHLQPQSMPQRSSVYIPPAKTASNVNNCNFATDIITTMAGADSSSVRAELGCLPGMECEVDNQLVFDVMDRYTGQG
jgi:hypothetical protein